MLASEDALAANDGEGVSRHVLRAKACGASGDVLGRAHLAHAGLSLWKGDNLAAGEIARDAMSLLDRGTERWFIAAGIASAGFGKVENTLATLAVVDELERTPANDAASGRARAIARSRAAIQLAYFGELARADALLEGCEREPGAAGDAGVLAWLCDAAFDRAFASGEPVHPSTFLRGRELYERIGDRRGAVTQAGNHVWTLAMLGAVDAARAELERFEREGAELGFHFTKVIAGSVRAIIAVSEGKSESIVEVVRTMRKGLASGRGAGGLGAWLAEILALAGRLDEAAAEVELALPRTANASAYRALTFAASAMVKVRRKDVAGALDDSARGMECAAHGVGLLGAYSPYLARFEALHAAGLDDEARAVLRSGALTLSRRAAKLGEYGPGYLAHGWRTAELMRLAREHGVAP